MGNLVNAYYEGLDDAISLIERGMNAGLSLKDSYESLKNSVIKTKEAK